MIKVNSLKAKISKYADQIGISGSAICLVHCILTSGIMILSTTASHLHCGHHHSHELDLWGFIDLSMIFISGIAVYFASKKAHAPILKNLMWFSYLIYAITMSSKFAGFEPVWLTIISYLASFLLIGAHLYNLKHGHSCEVHNHALIRKSNYPITVGN